ncbi:MAG TPA: VWA domain-containing protein [Pyrinomonadaceae bacterium]|nr:VWA domain-containing protein [Pyrinomonadaceae bacterium]
MLPICYYAVEIWMMFSKVQKAFLGLIFLAAFSPTTAYADDEIRIDLPAGGQLKVRNDFGNINAEVWGNSYVAVSANIGGDGSRRLSRSPIIIDNRGSLLTISVVRRPIDPVVPVDLNIKIPETSKFDASTTNGAITIFGMPSDANLSSSSGALTATFKPLADADITARSSRGTIKSAIGSAPSSNPQLLQTRLGNGGRKIELKSDTGDILLNFGPGIEIADNSPAPSSAKPPELIADNPKRPAGTPADSGVGGDLDEGDVIRVDSQLVTLNISVIDRGTNRGLAGLGQSDFKLFEDGDEQRIVQFESSSAPFDLILLIDLSGSTREVVKLIRAAALRFVQAARPADRIGVITFAGEATVVSTLTADRELLRQRIETIDTARGDTKLYDATNFAMDEVLKEAKKSRRSAIVLMSDGLDGTIPGISGQVGSKRSYQETLRNVQEFDGVLYTLWLNTEYEAMSPLDTQPEAFDMGHDRMKEMADAGGGVFYQVERLTDLAGAYEQVVADLGTMYSLAYRPSNSTRDGRWRAIRIKVERTNAVPRGKRGYYAN